MSQAHIEKSSRNGHTVDVSIVIPVTERPSDLADLYREFSTPLVDSHRSFEFLFALEPWYKEQASKLEELAKEGDPVRVLRASQTLGESALLRLGVANALGHVIVTLPAYNRVVAATIPQLIDRVESGEDMVIARRWPRRDSWINRLQHRFFHMFLGRLRRDIVHDVACGVQAMRREVFESVPLYGDFYRFFPLLAMNEGFGVSEVNAAQHPHDCQTRIYSPGVYVRRVIDLLGVVFLLRFTNKPLRFFGLFGSLAALSGGLILAVLAVQRIGGEGIADRPVLLLGVLLVVVGIQAVSLGLIGEIIVHLNVPRSMTYRLRDE